MTVSVLMCLLQHSPAQPWGYFNPFFISELLLVHGEQQHKKMELALCVVDLILGLSARLFELTHHIGLDSVPYGTACPGHQQSYIKASIFHSRNLDPKCFKCIY